MHMKVVCAAFQSFLIHRKDFLLADWFEIDRQRNVLFNVRVTNENNMPDGKKHRCFPQDQISRHSTKIIIQIMMINYTLKRNLKKTPRFYLINYHHHLVPICLSDRFDEKIFDWNQQCDQEQIDSYQWIWSNISYW